MTLNKKKPSVAKILLGALLLFFAIMAVAPFILMFVISLTQKTSLTLEFDPGEFSFQNYVSIFKGMHLGKNLKNSVIVVVGACFLNVSLSSLAAYAFAKKRFPGRDKIFFVYLATMMIPGQVTLIPSFLLMKSLGLVNTYLGLIIPFVGAFGVFLIRQFMISLPDDLFEAARLDGCNDFQMFRKIVLPLIKPVIITLIIFTFINSWNDYLWPLILTTDDRMQTVTLAIATMRANYTVNYGLVMAGTTVTFLPPFILYLLFQKQFVEGIALSGIKG